MSHRLRPLQIPHLIHHGKLQLSSAHEGHQLRIRPWWPPIFGFPGTQQVPLGSRTWHGLLGSRSAWRRCASWRGTWQPFLKHSLHYQIYQPKGDHCQTVCWKYFDRYCAVIHVTAGLQHSHWPFVPSREPAKIHEDWYSLRSIQWFSSSVSWLLSLVTKHQSSPLWIYVVCILLVCDIDDTYPLVI